MKLNPDKILQFVAYEIRWVASTPIIALCLWWLNPILGTFWATVVANLIGGAVFFWVDRLIFKKGEEEDE